MGRPATTPTAAAALAAVCVLLALPGCVRSPGRDPVPAPAPSGVQGISPAPGPSAPAPAASAPGPVLADGSDVAYLTRVDTRAGTVTFDLVVYLTGADADRAWRKAHPADQGGAPDGYLIINDNPQLRTLPLAAQVSVRVVDLDAPGQVGERTIKLADLPAHLSADRDDHLPYRLTVRRGQVTALAEMYLS